TRDHSSASAQIPRTATRIPRPRYKVFGEIKPARCPVSVGHQSHRMPLRQAAVACRAVTQWEGRLMEIQDLFLFCYYVAFATGIAGCCFAQRFRPSGTRALAIALVL